MLCIIKIETHVNHFLEENEIKKKSIPLIKSGVTQDIEENQFFTYKVDAEDFLTLTPQETIYAHSITSTSKPPIIDLENNTTIILDIVGLKTKSRSFTPPKFSVMITSIGIGIFLGVTQSIQENPELLVELYTILAPLIRKRNKIKVTPPSTKIDLKKSKDHLNRIYVTIMQNLKKINPTYCLIGVGGIGAGFYLKNKVKAKQKKILQENTIKSKEHNSSPVIMFESTTAPNTLNSKTINLHTKLFVQLFFLSGKKETLYLLMENPSFALAIDNAYSYPNGTTRKKIINYYNTEIMKLNRTLSAETNALPLFKEPPQKRVSSQHNPALTREEAALIKLFITQAGAKIMKEYLTYTISSKELPATNTYQAITIFFNNDETRALIFQQATKKIN